MDDLFQILTKHRPVPGVAMGSETGIDRTALLADLDKMEREWSKRIRLFITLFCTAFITSLVLAWVMRENAVLMGVILGGDGVGAIGFLTVLNGLSDKRTKIKQIGVLARHATDETLQNLIVTITDNFSDF